MEAVDQVQHLSHDHQLMLIKPEETDDVWDLTCYGCEQPISGSFSFYGCKQCVFFLHKTCAQPPRQMTHPYHSQHPLTFFADQSLLYRGSAVCDVCNEICNRFSYHCSLCNFDVDMKCALAVLSIPQSMHHESHPHQLIPLLQESLFLCAACGIKHAGTSFLCTTCGFWISQKCASSPLNLNLNNHHRHTLSLLYFIPQEVYSSTTPLYCQICLERINRSHWVYCCSKCHYVVHLRCAVNNKTETEELDSSNSETAPSDKIKSTKSDPSLIDLPYPDDSVDIIIQFIKHTRIEGKYKGAAEIKHISHDHPLTFFEDPSDHGSYSKRNKKCNGCAQSISAPFYQCVECKFFLHVWCAELPQQLRHAGHPEHPLFLVSPKGVRRCKCCNLYGNILFYTCRECKFSLDCKCASIPRVINHENHRHHLALRPTSNCNCISCGVPSSLSYECGGCRYYLCRRCLFLPRTVRHRYDELHPFILSYSRLPYQTDDDFCRICDEGIDSKSWFYHCGECKQYLHTECIFSAHGYPNIVYGHAVESCIHQHPVTCVHPNKDILCSLCNKYYPTTAYVCGQCKYVLCVACRIKIDYEGEK